MAEDEIPHHLKYSSATLPGTVQQCVQEHCNATYNQFEGFLPAEHLIYFVKHDDIDPQETQGWAQEIPGGP